MTKPLGLVCLASGGGRTVLNLQQAIQDGRVQATIEAVLVSRAEVAASSRCRDAGLTTLAPPTHGDLDDWILEQLHDRQPDLVCLCGYLRLLPMPAWLHGRVINIHPALLPDFGGPGMYGHHVHEAVLAAGMNESGCTVHYVDERYDHGPTILQRQCPVLPNDDAQTLAARVFEEECLALPEAVQQIAEDRRAGQTD
ncbi:MAG: phosphoribosylglycinamide formyltransferase [Phycisphaerales bacterium]|nr:phosphoribosylglycinamide formyltransferase [Phycisphaerales bacterium]